MTPRSRLIFRGMFVFAVASCTTLIVYGGWLAIVASAIVAGSLAVIELIGPTSDAGIKWTTPK